MNHALLDLIASSHVSHGFLPGNAFFISTPCTNLIPTIIVMSPNQSTRLGRRLAPSPPVLLSLLDLACSIVVFVASDARSHSESVMS